MQNEKARSWDVENMKTIKCKKIYDIGWKIRVVAKGKGP